MRLLNPSLREYATGPRGSGRPQKRSTRVFACMRVSARIEPDNRRENSDERHLLSTQHAHLVIKKVHKSTLPARPGGEPGSASIAAPDPSSAGAIFGSTVCKTIYLTNLMVNRIVRNAGRRMALREVTIRDAISIKY